MAQVAYRLNITSQTITSLAIYFPLADCSVTQASLMMPTMSLTLPRQVPVTGNSYLKKSSLLASYYPSDTQFEHIYPHNMSLTSQTYIHTKKSEKNVARKGNKTYFFRGMRPSGVTCSLSFV